MPSSPLSEPRDGGGDGHGPSGSKRRRISIACSPCRARKSRCSGEQPCYACVQLGVSCQYQRTTQGDSVVLPTNLVSNFQERLKAIEKLFQSGAFSSAAGLDPPGPLTPQSNRSTSSSDPAVDVGDAFRNILDHQQTTQDRFNHHGDYHGHRRAQSYGDSQSVASISNEPEVRNAIDGMAITVSEAHQSAFFGPSSNTVFLRQIQDMARSVKIPSMSDCIKRGTITVTPPIGRARETLSDQVKEIDELILPPQWVLEPLINEYFSHAALFFPYIHEPTFRATYEELKESGFRSVRRTWLALLNMVLAISAKLSTSSTLPFRLSSERAHDCTGFYLRAVKLCNDYMFCATSAEMVQCLLLMAWYLQSTQDSTRTWFIHGLAVKAAISLGFHSNLAQNGVSTVEEETRVRVWYGCILLDRILGLSFGRPWAIPKSFALPRRPSSFPVTSLLADGSGSRALQAERLGAHFLNEATKLSDIVVDIISNLYGDNLGFSQLEPCEKTPSMVLSHVGRLETWWANVHPSVRWHPNQTVDNDLESRMVNLIKTMLKLDFLNAQLLLYRPIVFLASRSQTSPEDQEHALFPKVIAICVRKSFQCACMLVSLVHDLQKSSGPLGGPPWFSLYQTFHAALSAFSVLLLTPELLPSPVHQNLLVLERAAEVLDKVDTSNKMGHTCSKYIRLLLSSIRGPGDSGSRDNAASNGSGLSSRRPEIQPIVTSQPEPRSTSIAPFQQYSMAQEQQAPALLTPYDFSEINLAQFFSQDQMDFFRFNGMGNGLA